MNCDETFESIRVICDDWFCCWLTFVESASSKALASRELSSMYFLVGNELYCNLGHYINKSFILKKGKNSDRMAIVARFVSKNLTW